MRIARLLFVLLALVVMAQPVFACRECLDDCVLMPGPTGGCHFTIDGCTSGIPCSGPGHQDQAAAQWSVASVEVTHSTPAAAPARIASRIVVASAAIPTNVR
jgi:hypothetical protein